MDEHHYYGCTMRTWTVGKTLEAVKQSLMPLGHEKFIAIYKVPLPIDSNYGIEFYAPKVEDTELVVANKNLFPENIPNVEYVGDTI